MRRRWGHFLEDAWVVRPHEVLILWPLILLMPPFQSPFLTELNILLLFPLPPFEIKGGWHCMASTLWLCECFILTLTGQPCERGVFAQLHVGICVSLASGAWASGWSVCVWFCRVFFFFFLQVLHWCVWVFKWLLLSFSLNVFTNTLRWSLHTENKMITIVNCGCGLAPTPHPSRTSLSFECPLTVHPIQVISILQRSTTKATAKSNRERVLIRGMKSQAYGALPPLRGPLLGRHGLKIRVSSCVSHSNSALMFERAEKMPALRG